MISYLKNIFLILCCHIPYITRCVQRNSVTTSSGKQRSIYNFQTDPNVMFTSFTIWWHFAVHSFQVSHKNGFSWLKILFHAPTNQDMRTHSISLFHFKNALELHEMNLKVCSEAGFSNTQPNECVKKNLKWWFWCEEERMRKTIEKILRQWIKSIAQWR